MWEGPGVMAGVMADAVEESTGTVSLQCAQVWGLAEQLQRTEM